MKKLLPIVILVSLMTASGAWSVCREAPAPALPSSDWIDRDSMFRAQDAVRSYLAAQEDYLTCVQNSMRHDAAIDNMRKVAKKYNNMTKRFKARMKSMDIITELALLEI